MRKYLTDFLNQRDRNYYDGWSALDILTGLNESFRHS
jgi:hypothetical protein